MLKAFAPLGVLLLVITVVVLLTLGGVLRGQERVPLTTTDTPSTVQLFSPGG